MSLVACTVHAQEAAGHVLTDLRIEAVACQQRVSLLAPIPRVGFPVQGSASAVEKAFCGQDIDGCSSISGCVRASLELQCIGVYLFTERPFGPLCQDSGDRLRSYALQREFMAECVLPARPGSIPALDPGSRECFIVEVAHLPKLPKHDLHKVRPVAMVDESSPGLLDGTRPHR